MFQCPSCWFTVSREWNGTFGIVLKVLRDTASIVFIGDSAIVTLSRDARNNVAKMYQVIGKVMNLVHTGANPKCPKPDGGGNRGSAWWGGSTPGEQRKQLKLPKDLYGFR